MPTFDEAAASVAGGQPQQPKRDPFDLAAEAVVNDQRTKQRATLFDAVRVNPDQAAKAKVLERETGTPTDVILRNLQDVEMQRAVEKVDAGLTNASKTLRNYFSTSDFARMSHDDLNSLLGIDYQMRKDYERGHSIGPYRGPEATPGSVLYGLAMSPVQGFKAAREGLGLQMSDLFETLGIFKLNEAEKANQLRKAAQAGSAAMFTTPAFESRTAAAIYGGVASTLQQAPGLALSVATRSPTPMLASAGLMTEAQSYTKYRARGATPGMAALAAGGEGAVEVATEMLPSKFLTEALGKAGMREFFTGLLAREIPGEQAATLLQDAIDTAIANPDKTWGQYLAERPMVAYETLVSTVTQSSIMGGISQTARILSRDQQKLETSDKQLATFEQMMATAGQSKLRERSPETFAQFVNEAATDAGAPTHVYVDARALTDALNQAGIPDEQLAQSMPSVPAQIAQAFESGGVVEIPVGEALAVAPGTPLEQVLLQNARLDPEGLSRLEVDEAAKQGDRFVKQAAEAIVKDAQTRLEHEDQVAQIRQTITDQLNQAGRFRPEANGAYATMVGAFYSTMAQRTGMTPAELYAKYPLKVTGEMQVGQLEQGGQDRRAALRELHRAKGVEFKDASIDRGGAHSPAGPEDGSPAYDVALNGTYPEDFYGPNGLRYYGTGEAAVDAEVYRHLQRLAGRPNHPITIYRAVEKNGPSKIQPGDWVTPVRAYAKDHGEGALNGDYKIIKLDVKARDVWTAGDSMLEWGYHPQDVLPEVRPPKADTLAQQTRATFSPEQMLIALGPNADYSSFLHESGHAFLEILSDVASQPGAPEQIVKDWQTTLDWFGVTAEQWAGMSLDQKRPYHERWAESTEQYFFEGKAPSVELRGVFDRFRTWLMTVYKSLKQFLASRSATPGGQGGTLAQSAPDGFAKFVGDAQRVDIGDYHEFQAGEPVVVAALHGTTGDFTAFDKSMANIESDLGGGFYFTNNPADVGENYAGMGPDLTNKIQGEAERLESNDDLDPDEAMKIARDKWMANEGLTMPVWVKMTNPAVLGGSDETFLSYEENYDEETDEYGEPTGGLIDLVGALREVAQDERYGDADVEQTIGELMEKAMDNGGLTAREFIATAKLSEGLVYATDYESDGKLAPQEILRRAFEAAGFDGFIDQTVDEKFGSQSEGQRKYGKGMKGMDESTVHFIAFKPAQIKSRLGNSGAYDESNPDILKQGDSAGPLGLTDEIRAVMDRLLATDDQIAEMERVREYGLLFKSPEEAGMTSEQWAKYTSEDEKAHAAALTELSKRSLRDMGIVMRKRMRALKDVQANMAEKRKDVEAEAAEIVAKEPIYRAMRWLKKGEALDAEGNVVKTEGDHKLDSTVLAELYPEADLSALKGMAKKGGLHPDLVAEQLGYDSGDQLVQALLGAFPQAEQVQGLTDQLMLERYGDLTTTRGQDRAADEAVHNENRARVLAAEFNALSAARQSVNVVTKAAKLFAENLVRNKKVGDLKPTQHSAAETRAAKAAEKALAAGKTNEAVQAKRDQVLQFQAARATLAAQEEVAKGLAYLKKFDKESTRKGLDVEYTDQIDKLLERVELRERTIRELDKREKLAAWIKSQEEIGVEPDIPDYLAEDVQLQNYKRMTVDEFRGLIAAVKQIEHLGRLKKRLLTAKDKREFAAVVEDLVSSIIANGKGRQADTRTPADTLGSALLTLRNFGAAHIKAATWARILDGGKDGGPMWERFVRGANEAGDKETTMRAEATEALTKIMLPWLKGGKTGGKGKFFPSINRSLNRQQVLAIALNTGNESNLQRLLGGEGWTLEQLQPVLDTVTAADWQVAQQVWDYFESLRPQVAEMERDVFGKEPDWIAPGSPVTQRAGIKGGYYPVKYDPLASQRAEQHQDAEAAKRQLQGAYSAATVRKSFTKGRAEEVVGRPLLYTLGGVYSGINDTIHYLAWQRWLVDTNRLLRSRSVDAAIRNTYGPEVVKQFRTWRDAAAEGESGVQEALDTALGKLRQSVSVAGLGFNVMSALMQPLGFTQSTVRIGPQWMAKGLQHYIANPVAASREANEKSSFMENRARTRFREINELRNRVSGETTARRVLNENAYRLMMTMQRVVDVPTWWGAYEKAIADGQTEERAVDLADQAVIDSQGGGQTKDLSAIERGGPAQKLFTVFYSFMNTALNLATTSATTQGKAKAAADILLITVVPAVLGALMKAALTPGDSGDDDPEKLAKKLAGEVVGYFMGMFVIGREFAEAGKIALGLSDGAFDYKGPAGVRIIGDAQALAKQAAQGEVDDAFRKASINLAGDLFGLPSAQINRTVTGAKALAEGETQNPAALALGYQKPR